MAQHDYVIANGTGAAVRSDLNNALSAIVTQNSGSTAPATTYAYMMWPDTTAGVMKMRNGANSAWITLYQLNGEWSSIAFENGSAAAPSIYFKDSGTDTGFYSPGTDQVGISTGGTARLTIDASGNVNIDSNTLYVDASNNRVGLGTSSPSYLLDVNGQARFNGSPIINGTSLDINPASGLPNISFRSGNTYRGYIEGNASGGFTFGTGPAATTAMTIDSSQRVGIGTTPSTLLHIQSTDPAFRFKRSDAGTDAYGELTTDTSGLVTMKCDPANAAAGSGFRITVDNSEALRVDSSSRLLVGTTSSPTVGDTQYGRIRTVGNTAVASGFGLMSIARGEAASSITVDEEIGYLTFTDNAGGAFAHIECRADGTAGSSDYPGRLVFSTCSDGSASPTERLRITNNGSYFATIPGGSTIYPGFWCRAWVNFNGTGTVAIRASGNVSSITDNGVGDYTVNFTTAMPDVNYSVCGSSADNNGGTTPTLVWLRSQAVAPTTSAVRIGTRTAINTDADTAYATVAIFR